MNICLIAARRALGMSRTQFAAAVGVTPATVKRWDQGSRFPTQRRVEKIERILTDHSVNLMEVAQ